MVINKIEVFGPMVTHPEGHVFPVRNYGLSPKESENIGSYLSATLRTGSEGFSSGSELRLSAKADTQLLHPRSPLPGNRPLKHGNPDSPSALLEIVQQAPVHYSDTAIR